ncbi:MAG: hypothetical protein LBJ62_06705 [Bifidobacteriaceae bacterium]|jgi:hypothetical protein|nr:hypothetical protein [Bifidobacteriaceae bacterium]
MSRLLVSLIWVVSGAGLTPVALHYEETENKPATVVASATNEDDLDPRLAEMIVALANERLGNRYVDLWVAANGSGFVLGVLNPVTADQAVLTEANLIAPVSMAACPVARSALNGAVNTAIGALGAVSSANYLGTVEASTWYSSPQGGTIAADVARFPAPANASATVFVSSGVTRNVTGWANPVRGTTACFRGAFASVETCGTIAAVNTSYTVEQFDGTTRTVANCARINANSSEGDSGAPVYYRGSTGVVILGVLSGGDTGFTTFSPMWSALGTVGATVVRGPGLGVPVVAPGDWNGDGLADIAGRQNSTGKLYFYRSTGSGAFATKVQIGTGY